MSDLAFNLTGEPFEVPGAAAAWRVRKLEAKSAPEVAYGRAGHTVGAANRRGHVRPAARGAW